MQNLLAFITRYYHWILLFILEIISGILLFQYNSYQGSVWFSSANRVAGKVYEWQSAIEQFFSLTERSERLARHNVELEYELTQMRKEIAELKGDTTITDSAMYMLHSNMAYIPAKVVSNQLDRRDNLITIDKGSADGVAADMGVTCGEGLVGVVFMAGTHYSVVMPILNSHSRISCSIRDSHYFGYLTWDGKSPSEAYLEDIPRHAQFNKGDWVETSGYSSIFPPGITVGRIADVGNSTDGLSYRLKVQLATDFGCLRDVCVLNDTTIAERVQLLITARDSMAKN